MPARLTPCKTIKGNAITVMGTKGKRREINSTPGRLSPPCPDNGTEKRERSSAPRWPRRSGRCGAARGLRPLCVALLVHSAMERPGRTGALRRLCGTRPCRELPQPGRDPGPQHSPQRDSPRRGHGPASLRAAPGGFGSAGSGGSRSAARHHRENGALRRAKK